MMKCIYVLGLVLLSFTVFSQRGKDGTVTISTSTIVNAYTPLTANTPSNSTILPVGNSGAFAIGDLILIIQMQGTSVNSYHGGTTGPWFDTNSALPTDTTFGRIINYYNTGKNEFAQIRSIPNGTSIEVDCGLQNDYDVLNNINTPTGALGLQGHVQVIRVPRYSFLTVNAGGSITCPQWNGITGGVAVVEVQNDAALNTAGSFNVTGKGFRGGTVFNYNLASIISSDKYGSNLSQEGGAKGESIAGDSAFYRNYASVFARGNIANGGGGGNSHNAGGGGGANGHNGVNFNSRGNPVSGYNNIWNLETANFSLNTSSGGGRGGYSFSNSNQNVSTVPPGTYSTATNAWGGDKRRAVGGFGGRPLNYINNRLFLGGGGGAGQGNDNRAGAGGNGGGMAYLVCYGNLSGSGTIVADGANGFNTGTGCATNDGAGGGGGGGTIILKVNGTTSLTAVTALSANGGNGGNVNFSCGLSNATAYGPGASGGGGYIAASGTLPGNSINGGNNGIVSGNANNIGNNFPPNGATRGGSGGTGSVTTYTLNASANQTICTNQSFTITASSTEPGTSINWFTANAGGTAIATGTTYASPGYTATGTYTLYAGACPGTYRQPIIITVGAGLNITANSPTICPTQSVTLTASGATSYTWNPGNLTGTTVTVSLSSSTIYSITGTNGVCSGTYTTNVSVASVPIISVADATVCSGNSATLTAGGASSYTWAPGSQTTSSIVVTQTTNTTYTITGSNGVCTNSTTASVSITTTPTLTANSATICPGQAATFTVNGASSYTWNPGGLTGNTFTISPSSSGTVSVSGANGTCISQITRSVTVSSSPTITASNQTICPTQTVTLTAGGAATFTWNPGNITGSSISVSPSSLTVYTVSGTIGSCSSGRTVTVTVATIPNVSVSNATICSGNSTTLTASGATSFTWTPGNQTTTTLSVNPPSNASYTVTGSNGTCTNSAVATVSVTNTPTLTVNSVTICPGQTATLTVSGVTSYTWNPGNISGTNYTISPASSTTVSVTGENGNCFSSATVSVTIGTGISISVNNPTICAGQTASLTASGATTFTWSTGQTTNTLNISPVNTTTYIVSGTSGTCSGSNTAVVTVISVPSVSVTNAAICSGGSATLTASGAASYTWMPGGQLTSAITDSPTSTTIYTITGANGNCTNTANGTISVTATPSLVANSTTICPGQTATLTVSGANTYTWNPGNISGNTFTLSPLSDVSVSVTGENNTCSSSATVNVTIGSGISISVNNPTICAGQTASLIASGATTYTWDNGATTNTLNVNPLSTTIYTITGSNGSCNGVNTATVTVVNSPTVSVTSASICSGNSATLTASGAISYTWSAGTLTTTSITDNPGTTTIYTVTGSDGTCSNTATTSINVTITPTLVANSVTICAGQTATLTVVGASSYTWDPGSVTGNTYTISPLTNTFVTVIGANGTCTAQATPSVTIGSGISISVNNPTICAGETASLTAGGAITYTWDSGANTNTLNVSPISTTIYTVTGSNGSCNGFNTATVTVNSVPTVTVNSPIICAGETASLIAGGATSYTWDSGANTNTLNVTPSATTNYTITGSNGNCTSSNTSTVTVNSVPTLTVNPASICAGQTATLIAMGATTYTWSTAETTQTINPTPANTSTYSVIGSNGNCNSASSTVTVTISPSPTLSVNALNTTGCSPVCVNFTDVTSSSCSAILYNFGDGSTGVTNNPTHCYSSGGTYTVTAMCTNTLGCVSTFTMPGVIQVSTSPSADFVIVEGNIVTVGSTINLTNSSSNASSYIWSLCGSVSTLTNVTTSYADTGSCCIELVALNTTGCSDTITKCIQIVDQAIVVIPNVFTPNGDASNEFFKIKSTGIKSLNCVIFDRWGLKMHEWDGINGYWDGAAKSGLAPDGTYFYIINYTDHLDNSTTEKGFLNLFRD